MRGRSTRARAIATRWRCPPESCAGKRPPWSTDSPTRSSASATRRSISGVAMFPCAMSGIATMSRTRRLGLSEAKGSWKTGWISRARARRSMADRRCPSTATSPAVGSSRPRMRRANVDLPQPLSPTTPSTLPAGTAKDTSSTAITRLGGANSPWRTRNSRRRPRTSIAGVTRRPSSPGAARRASRGPRPPPGAGWRRRRRVSPARSGRGSRSR